MVMDGPTAMDSLTKPEGLKNGAREEKLTATQRRNILVYKVAKQVSIVGVWFCLGLFVEIVGPTIPDLTERIGIDYGQIGFALSIKAVGFFAGSLAGGFLHEVLYRHTDLLMALGVTVGAVGAVVIPWSTSVGMLAFVLFLTGVSEGVINTGGNTLTMHLWGKSAASPMHSVHFGFGAGAIIAPQLALPFLSPDVATVVGNVTFGAITSPRNVTSMNVTDTPVLTPSRLEYPYLIVAAITMFFAIVMLGFYIVKPPAGFPVREVPPHNFRRLVSPATCGRGSFIFGSSLLAVLFLFFFQAVGGERAYGKYLFTYAIESEVQFTKSQAASLSSVFWACHVFGRFSGMIVSRFVPTPLIILIDVCGSVLTTTLLNVVGYNVPIALWVLTGFMGYFVSFMFPCGMSWANLYLDMNSLGTMVLLMGGAVGAMVYQYLPGFLIEHYGPRSLMYVMLSYSILSVVVFAAMHVIGRKRGDRFSAVDTGKEDNEEEQVGQLMIEKH